MAINMENKDTVRLLKECDAGTKMGISSIDEVLERVVDEKLKSLLQESKAHHKELENEINTMLDEMGKEEGDRHQDGGDHRQRLLTVDLDPKEHIAVSLNIAQQLTCHQSGDEAAQTADAILDGGRLHEIALVHVAIHHVHHVLI